MKKCLIISVLLLFTLSCSVTKHLPKGEYLLLANNYDIQQTKEQKKIDKIKKSDIEPYIISSQTPKASFLGLNLRERIYNSVDPEKNSWWNRTIRNLGKAPMIYDSIDNSRGLKNIHRFFEAKGYFHAEVENTVVFKKKKATVNYFIIPNNPYFINSIEYVINDDALKNNIYADTVNSLLKVGNIYNSSTLDKERKRIYKNLHNNGFYDFNVEAVNYIVDTIRSPKNVALIVNIEKRLFDNVRSEHKQYMVGNVIIDPNYSSTNSVSPKVKHDTTLYKGAYYISHDNKSKFRPRVLSRAVEIETGSLYSLNETTSTGIRIYDIDYFRGANVFYERRDNTEDGSFGVVDCKIQLVPELKQGFKADAEMSTNSNYTGISLTLGYVNKNLFRGAEIFDFSVTGSYDFFNNRDRTDSYEFGASTSLTFPRLLPPLSLMNTRNYSNVSTQVAVSYNTQRRPDYNRTISTISYGYNWTDKKKKNYYFKPVAISLVSVPRITQSFLDDITNEYLKATYKSQIIAGMNFGIIVKEQAGFNNFFSFKANAETSGNLLYLCYLASNAKKTSSTEGDFYKIFNLQFAQYCRVNFEFSYKYKFGEAGALVYRFYSGAGVAYGNMLSMPFERMFFAGGSNSMRGWQVRTLGPGSSVPENDAYPNQTGTIRLETNIEGRFMIYGPLKGAVFFDLGNVWMNARGEKDELKKFKFNTFCRQLGFNTGVGLRLDFSQFVLRLDWGIPLYNPALEQNDRWVSKIRVKDTALHFGIGYPF